MVGSLPPSQNTRTDGIATKPIPRVSSPKQASVDDRGCVHSAQPATWTLTHIAEIHVYGFGVDEDRAKAKAFREGGAFRSWRRSSRIESERLTCRTPLKIAPARHARSYCDRLRFVRAGWTCGLRSPAQVWRLFRQREDRRQANPLRLTRLGRSDLPRCEPRAPPPAVSSTFLACASERLVTLRVVRPRRGGSEIGFEFIGG